MCKFVATREDLGSRKICYTVYESKSKEFIGMTEKAIITALKNNEVINGFKLVEEELSLDDDGFHQVNLMAHSGANSYNAIVENECPVNNFYTVVKVMKDNGKTVYEVISSRHGRMTITEEKLKVYLDMNVIQGGAWIDSKGKLNIAKGVEADTDIEDKKEGLSA